MSSYAAIGIFTNVSEASENEWHPQWVSSFLLPYKPAGLAGRLAGVA